MKKTLIIGASSNPERYANKAANLLVAKGHGILQIGIKEGVVAGQEILTGKPTLNDNIHTVTLYVSAKNQPEWYEYVKGLKPRRVIFNPGTENEDFAQQLQQEGIEPLEACTLVMLTVGIY